jgi:hypothetical protein
MNKVQLFQDRILTDADHPDAADKRIHPDQRSLLGRVLKGSINRVEVKVPHFLEEFGVKLFTIRGRPSPICHGA